MGTIIGIILVILLVAVMIWVTVVCIGIGSLISMLIGAINAVRNYLGGIYDEVTNPFMRILLFVTLIVSTAGPIILMAIGIATAILA